MTLDTRSTETVLTNQGAIVAAIRRLASSDSKERVRAREALEAIGGKSTWHLIQAVHPLGEQARRAALEILVDLADPAAAELFVELLDGEDSGCRWLAAEGLAALGEEGLRRVLELLVEFPKTARLERSTHHALGGLRRMGFEREVAPVLRAFQGAVRELEVPTAAFQALDSLRKASPSRHEHATPTER